MEDPSFLTKIMVIGGDNLDAVDHLRVNFKTADSSLLGFFLFLQHLPEHWYELNRNHFVFISFHRQLLQIPTYIHQSPYRNEKISFFYIILIV